MNFRFRPLVFQSILVIMSAVSISPALKAQDIIDLKPITPNESIPQPRTQLNSPDGSTKPTGEVQPLQESNAPDAGACAGKTPSTSQPSVPEPTGTLNSPQIKRPSASELTAPLERETNPMNPVSPVPQSQPTSPSR